MYVFVLGSFYIYVTVFVLLQQVIGLIGGAKNVQRYQYPRFPLFLSISLILVTLGTVLMKGSDLASFPVIRFTGVAVCVFGLWLSMHAQYDLGKYWVGGIGIHGDHKLITKGVYRFVRHPLYSGMLISAVGLCLITLNPVYGLGCLIYFGAYALRVPYEEYQLEKKFKKKYQRYADTTGALFPIIRKRG